MINGELNSSGKKDFLCDTVDDIKKLPRSGFRGTLECTTDYTLNDPCSIGSTALVCSDDGTFVVYMLMPSNEWKKL